MKLKILGYLLCIAPVSYALSPSLRSSVSIEAAFSSSFSATHPAHAGAYGIQAEFQKGGPVYFYSRVYLDYQFHEVNTHNIDFGYGNILQIGGTFGLGGTVFKSSIIQLRLNLALIGVGLTYNPRFSSYGMHGRSVLALNMDFPLGASWGVRLSPHFGVAYQFLLYEGQVAKPASILLGIGLGFFF